MAVGCPRNGDSTGPQRLAQTRMTPCMRPKWNVRSPRRQRSSRNSALSSVRRGSSATRTSSACGYSLVMFLPEWRSRAKRRSSLRSRSHGGSPRSEAPLRVSTRVFERDGFAFTLWRHYEQPGIDPSAASYAKALEGLHAGMAQLDVVAAHFSDRVSEAQRLLRSDGRTPRLEDTDRELLLETLRSCGSRIYERSSREQLLHGEPHPGNVLSAAAGLLFIDFETCCRGPVELDLAHVPEAVCEAYSGADPELIQESRRLVLAMVAAWRWDIDDQFPSGARAGRALLRALRAGPPWPTLDVVMNQET